MRCIFFPAYSYIHAGSAVYAIIWLQVETKIGILSACLPVLPPLCRRVGKSIHISSYFSHMHTSLHSRFSKLRGSTPATSQAGTAASNTHLVDTETVGGSHSSRRKKGSKGWYSVAMSALSSSGRDEDSHSTETLVHQEKRSPSVSV